MQSTPIASPDTWASRFSEENPIELTKRKGLWIHTLETPPLKSVLLREFIIIISSSVVAASTATDVVAAVVYMYSRPGSLQLPTFSQHFIRISSFLDAPPHKTSGLLCRHRCLMEEQPPRMAGGCSSHSKRLLLFTVQCCFALLCGR